VRGLAVLRWSEALPALRSRNFRLFFAGQTISLIGTWVQQMALSWLVYRLTGSAFILGLVGFLGQLPGLVVAPFAGVLADRVNRYPVLLATQTLSMIQALTLAALVLTGRISVPAVLALSACLGIVNGFDIPIRQSFLVEMVDERSDLPNAIALNSAMFNAARLVGPALAGVIITLAGEGVCFLLNGLSYVAVLLALLAMRVEMRPARSQPPAVFQLLGEGVHYAFGFAPVRAVLMLLALVSLTGTPYTVLMPVMAATVLHGDAHTLGTLMAATGLGALGGTLYLVSRRTVLGLSRLLVLAAALFGLGLIAFSRSRSVGLSMLVLAITGFGMIVQTASSNTILQTIVDEDKRGRVMSLYTMAFTGMMPLGSLLAGAMAGRFGAPTTIALGGATVVAGAAVFASRLRRTCVRSTFASASCPAATPAVHPRRPRRDGDSWQGSPPASSSVHPLPPP
jgi:MFS family permease